MVLGDDDVLQQFLVDSSPLQEDAQSIVCEIGEPVSVTFHFLHVIV